jgi:hypothetical protein
MRNRSIAMTVRSTSRTAIALLAALALMFAVALSVVTATGADRAASTWHFVPQAASTWHAKPLAASTWHAVVTVQAPAVASPDASTWH